MIEALLRHRHRPSIATLLGLEAAVLPTLAAVANTIPVVTLPFATWRDSSSPTEGQ